jgi:hypothetical protein
VRQDSLGIAWERWFALLEFSLCIKVLQGLCPVRKWKYFGEKNSLWFADTNVNMGTWYCVLLEKKWGRSFENKNCIVDLVLTSKYFKRFKWHKWSFNFEGVRVIRRGMIVEKWKAALYNKKS